MFNILWLQGVLNDAGVFSVEFIVLVIKFMNKT